MTRDPVLDAYVETAVLSGVAADAVGWMAHRTASSRAISLLERIAERSDAAAWWASAGYELGTRATTADEMSRAVDHLLHALDAPQFRSRNQVLLAELLIALDEDARVAELIERGSLEGIGEIRRQMLEADLVNPFRVRGSSEHAWVSAVAPLFDGLATVGLEPTSDGEPHEPLDRLTAVVEPGSVRGELVTVVVSSYRPDAGLRTAVRSLIAQTWADLEIIVVDDASGREFQHAFDAVAALDPRVRVIHQQQNGGTYSARNTAIAEARGAYVTFQDADDWSHPQRIEHEVAALTSDPLVHSVRAHALRTTGSLVFSRLGTAVRAPAAATLMFRRAQVWPALGGYDLVRKAADTEFHERILATMPGYGIDLEEPLMWVRLGEGSLSRSEFRANWKHPARLLYRSAFSYWHERIRSGASPVRLPNARSFPAPRKFAVDAPSAPASYDVVVLGDWRGRSGATLDAIEWLRPLVDSGRRIALVHVERLTYDGPRASALIPQVQTLVASAAVDAVPWDEEIVAGVVIATEPEVLEFLPDTEPGTRTDRVVVVLDASPRVPGLLESIEGIVQSRWAADVVWSTRATGAEAQAPPRLPRVMPAAPKEPLLRTTRVVVVAPMDVSADTLDDTASITRALVLVGLDVRMRLAPGLRQSMRRQIGRASNAVLWSAPLDGGAGSATPIATDLVIVGTDVGIDVDRLLDDADVWGVRVHTLPPRTPLIAATPEPGDEPEHQDAAKRDAVLTEFTALLASAPLTPPDSDLTRRLQVRAEANEMVLAWVRSLSRSTAESAARQPSDD